jgi:hypothetical protein
VISCGLPPRPIDLLPFPNLFLAVIVAVPECRTFFAPLGLLPNPPPGHTHYILSQASGPSSETLRPGDRAPPALFCNHVFSRCFFNVLLSIKSFPHSALDNSLVETDTMHRSPIYSPIDENPQSSQRPGMGHLLSGDPTSANLLCRLLGAGV